MARFVIAGSVNDDGIMGVDLNQFLIASKIQVMDFAPLERSLSRSCNRFMTSR